MLLLPDNERTMPSQTPRASHALEVVRDYHQRTKHRFEGYARGPETLDWDEQPAPFRHFEPAPQIKLPLISTFSPESLPGQALQRPFTALGRLQPALAPSLESIAVLLQLSLGLTAWKRFGPDRWAVRANPSSGNLHPTEAYLVIGGIAGLTDGLYHYRPEEHALELRAEHEGEAGEPRLGILLTSVMWREAWKYGERSFRYCQLDTGHAAGALRYAAAVLGWHLQEQAQVDSVTLARLAGVDRLEEFPARRAQETEIEEAEILLAAGFGNAAPPSFDPARLQTLAERAQWHGTASPIDQHPMYRWPVIAEIAAATRRNGGEFQPGGLPSVEPDVSRSIGTASQTTAHELLTNRRSAQRFDHDYVMTHAQFAAIVSRLQPSNALPWDVFGEPPRAALVFFVSRVEGLAPGLYLLPRSTRSADSLRPRLDQRFACEPVAGIDALLKLTEMDAQALKRMVRSLHCHQDIAATACFALGMLFDFETALQQSPANYRSLYREAGLIGQVLYLEAEAHGLRGTGIGCFFDDPVHALLGLQDGAWQTLYHFTVGLPITDPRIESAPAYTDLTTT